MVKNPYLTIVLILFLINANLTLAEENNRELDISKFFSDDFITTQNFQFGVDHWTGPSYNPNPLLRNRTESGHYSIVIPWAKYTGQFQPFANDRSKINLHMRTDLDNGFKLDRFDYDFSFTKSIGIKFGLVNMKMNPCRMYEPDNPWLMEPSTSCRISLTSIYRSSNSSPGVQLYLNSFGDYWFFSYQAGYYKPNLSGYDKTEFGYQQYRTSYYTDNNINSSNQTEQNDKFGVNFQAFNPDYNIDFRAGLILSTATANIPESEIPGWDELVKQLYGKNNFVSHLYTDSPLSNKYKIIFSSLRTSIFDTIGITFTFNYYTGSTYTPDQLYIDNTWYLDPFLYLKGGYTDTIVHNYGAEISFPITDSSKLVTYIGNSIQDTRDSNSYNTNKKVIAAAYRSDYANGFYYVIQAMTGYSAHTYYYWHTHDKISETTLGFRLGYQF